jgi:cysteine desulfurase/selenocysteine lyase
MSDIKAQFPILKRHFYDRPLVYLDSAATTQKPQCVIDAVSYFYENENANVHRGIYKLSEEATKNYEDARQAVAQLIDAPNTNDIVFTKGTTESINLVATSYGRKFVNGGDEIIISTMEHHSNIVPWQLLCERTGATLKIIPMNDDGVLDLKAYKKLLNPRVKMVGVVHVSNALGIVNPIKEMIELAHETGIPVLVDGAQALPHMQVSMKELDCDFYAFSGHKMYGPTGIGGLYAKSHWLEQMPPYQGGGDMIRIVTFEKTEYNSAPSKFEAGTPNMAGVAGLKAAVEFINKVGYDTITARERDLYAYAESQLTSISGLNIIGKTAHKVGALSFTLDAVHPHDISTILDQHAVAIRAGHHCAMPLMKRLGLAATARASFGVYNERSDIDRLCEGLKAAVEMFVG